jgi:hypothetical protein
VSRNVPAVLATAFLALGLAACTGGKSADESADGATIAADEQAGY